MGTLNEDLSAIKAVEDTIIANKVARFAYTDEAYEKNDANGVPVYNVNNAQNIPTADPSVLKVNDTVLSRGYRAQASSITRMLMNHFLGRLSYNVNKVNDGFSNLVATLIKHRGTANGFATLDENGRIPYSQLPESANGDVKTVNNISPVNGNIPLTGENIPVSSTDPTLLSSPLTTDRYANSSVTTEKIADDSVTNAKIKDPISVAKGGTGETTGIKACNSLLKSLETGENTPIDTDTFISQYAGGSASDVTSPDKDDYYRRPFSALWEYIKSKISSVLGLTATAYSGKSAQSSFLAGYTSTRLTSGNIVPKDSSEYGGMRKDIVSTLMTDGSRPDQDGHLLTMFWDNEIRGDTQLFVSNNDSPLKLKARTRTNNEGYGDWVDIITSDDIGSQTVANAGTANKIVPNYTKSYDFTTVTTETTKYIKLADCDWNQTGTLQVYLAGDAFEDTLVINFGGGHATHPMLCGYCISHRGYVKSVIAQKGLDYNSNYSIYLKLMQLTHLSVSVALLKGDCTINITESTTAPTNISEWVTSEGFFGNLTGNLTGNATNAYNAYRGMVHTCSTDARTASKTVSIPGFTLTQGACIRVLFINGNNVASPTLNVNNTGAKEIRVKQGSEYVPLSAENGALGMGAYGWQSNTLLELFYTGTYWIANENAIVHEKLNSELGYLSSKVFINGRKEIWGGTSPYDITANESKVMTISSDLPINDDISNHSLSVITEIESTYVNAYGDIKLMDNTLKFSIYSRNLTNNSYSVKTVHIFVTGY